MAGKTLTNKLGDIVLYSLTKDDVQKIDTGRSDGTRTRFGARLAEGQIFPAIVVGVNIAVDPVVMTEPKPEGQKMDTNEDAANPNDDKEEGKEKELEYLNLKVFLDGADDYWRQSALPDESKAKDEHTPGFYRKA